MAACRMSEFPLTHQPVLMDEVLAHLAIKPDGIYLDATFGRGGHAAAILQALGPRGRLLALDKDPLAIAYARQHFDHDPRFTIEHGSFAVLANFLTRHQLYGQIDGVLFDLGVSSPQLDDPNRGFSFMRSGALDMRMDTSQGMDAATLLATIEEKELARILWEYGEERYSRRIARAILTAQAEAPITTTERLAAIVRAAIPQWQQGKNPATRSFQAIRIAVNHELTDLEQGLPQALAALKNGGRLAVISFHSLEDRIVKHFMRDAEQGQVHPSKLPIKVTAEKRTFQRIGKAIKPSTQEVQQNPRARSAVLRIGEKLS